MNCDMASALFTRLHSIYSEIGRNTPIRISINTSSTTLIYVPGNVRCTLTDICIQSREIQFPSLTPMICYVVVVIEPNQKNAVAMRARVKKVFCLKEFFLCAYEG